MRWLVMRWWDDESLWDDSRCIVMGSQYDEAISLEMDRYEISIWRSDQAKPHKDEELIHMSYEWALTVMWVMSHFYVSHVTHMTCICESCDTWMSCVKYEWVMSHMNGSCHIWMSHVTYEWVRAIKTHKEGEHADPMVHIWFTCKKKGGGVPALPRHTWMRHVTYEGVISRVDESCHIWMSHDTWMSPVT